MCPYIAIELKISMKYEFHYKGLDVSQPYPSVSINLNTNMTELYTKRATVFKFRLFEVNISRSSGVFYLAIYKRPEETLQSEERTRRQQTFYRSWRKPLQRL